MPPRTGEREHGPRIRRGQTPTKWPTWLFLTETWRLFPDRRAHSQPDWCCTTLGDPSPRLDRIGTIGKWVLRVTREVIQ